MHAGLEDTMLSGLALVTKNPDTAEVEVVVYAILMNSRENGRCN